MRLALVWANQDSSRETQFVKGRRSIAVAALVLFALNAIITCSDVEEPPLIFAAASLVDVMEEIRVEYEKETGQSVRLVLEVRICSPIKSRLEPTQTR